MTAKMLKSVQPTSMESSRPNRIDADRSGSQTKAPAMTATERSAPNYRWLRGQLPVITNLIPGLVLIIFIVSGSIYVTLKLTMIYDLSATSIINSHHLNQATIKANYQSLINYVIQNEPGTTLPLQGFKLSDSAFFHFEEVRQIINSIIWSWKITAIIVIIYLVRLLVGLKFCKLRQPVRFVKPAILTLGGTAVIFTSWILLDFNRAFVTMHHLLFNNDYWLFDPQMDPIINYLPADHFWRCGICIGIFIMSKIIIFLIIQNCYNKKCENLR